MIKFWDIIEKIELQIMKEDIDIMWEHLIKESKKVKDHGKIQTK